MLSKLQAAERVNVFVTVFIFVIVGFVPGIVPPLVVCKTKPVTKLLTSSKTTVVELLVAPSTVFCISV